MNRRMHSPTSAKARSLDLSAFDKSLAQLLPLLLLMRDRDALVRWSKVRSWVDNAMAGDAAPELLTMELAIAYLIECTQDSAEPDRSDGRPAR